MLAVSPKFIDASHKKKGHLSTISNLSPLGGIHLTVFEVFWGMEPRYLGRSDISLVTRDADVATRPPGTGPLNELDSFDFESV